jgi:hypothetical protein
LTFVVAAEEVGVRRHPTPAGHVIHEVVEAGDRAPRLRVETHESLTTIEYDGCVVTWESASGLVTYSSNAPDPAVVWSTLTRLALPIMALRRSSSNVALHGSAVTLGGAAWIFVGPSGAGKSTAVGDLLERGGLLLSDDFTLVDVANGKALPGPPEIRLWAEPRGVPEVVDQGLVFDTRKRWFHLHESRTSSTPAAVRGIVYLSPQPGVGATVIDRLPAAKALAQLLANSFAFSAAPRDEREGRFRRVAALGALVPSFVCRYHKSDERRREHVDRLSDFLTAPAREL